MKKKLSLMAVAAITAFTMSVNAQNPQNTQQNNCEGACAKTEQCCRQGKKAPRGEGKQMREGKQRPDSMAAFKGIELTEAQKTQIAKIRTDMREARKAQAEARKAQAQENKADKNAKADKATRSEARMQAKLDYLHQIQKVLTPEQYITFLENTAVMNGQGQPKGMHRQGMRADKGQKQKGDRQMKNRDGKKDKGQDKAKGQRPDRKETAQK